MGLLFEFFFVLLALTSNYVYQNIFRPPRHFCSFSSELASNTVSSAYNVINRFGKKCKSDPVILIESHSYCGRNFSRSSINNANENGYRFSPCLTPLTPMK